MALHAQPEVANWPVKSRQHKPSIITKWYPSTELCSHSVVHCKGPCSMERKKKTQLLFPPRFPSLLCLPSAAEIFRCGNSWALLYPASRRSQGLSREKACIIWGQEALNGGHLFYSLGLNGEYVRCCNLVKIIWFTKIFSFKWSLWHYRIKANNFNACWTVSTEHVWRQSRALERM